MVIRILAVLGIAFLVVIGAAVAWGIQMFRELQRPSSWVEPRIASPWERARARNMDYEADWYRKGYQARDQAHRIA